MFTKESYITAFILMAIGPVSRIAPAVAQSSTPHEYRVKAAFMYQFVNFIDGWKFQQGDNQDNDGLILIGIIGDNHFQDAFEPLKEKQVKGRDVTIQYFKGLSQLDGSHEKTEGHPKIEEIKQCDLLFICSSEERFIDDLLDPIRRERILTIADMPGFIESGGIINFVVEKNKVRFEINTAGAHRSKLDIRSKLLRLAQRVITTDDVDEK